MSGSGGITAVTWASGWIWSQGSTVALAIERENLIDRWRGLGGELWFAAAAVGALWLLLFGVLAAATNPRRVEPGPASLDLGGPEPPAIVSLLTRDWRLGRDALPATLLDLAARRYLAIEQVGDQTLVRTRNTVSTRNTGNTESTQGPEAGDLTTYERMVLDHVHRLAARAHDGVVPAEALTTGPDEGAKGWWRRFERAVRDDARRRGLSRPRWSHATKAAFGIAAAVVAVSVGLAVSATWDEVDRTTETRSDKDDNPVTAAFFLGIFTLGGLTALVAATDRERDTPAGRQASARWLGLRELLGDDPIFGDHPPAGVAMWDRHLAYGASLGVAHGAVRALPLGAESDTEAWSSVGGRWRRVRVRYPTRIPPGYGRAPLRVAALGLLQLLVAGFLLSRLPGLPDAVGNAARDLRPDRGNGTSDTRLIDLIELVAQVVTLTLAIVAATIVLRAAVMFVLGAVDLVGGRRTIEGRIVRLRVRGDDEHRSWRVAVDDGGSDEIRAWRLRQPVPAQQGDVVRARVTRHLAHVADLERISAGPSADTTAGRAIGVATVRGVDPPEGAANDAGDDSNAADDAGDSNTLDATS